MFSPPKPVIAKQPQGVPSGRGVLCCIAGPPGVGKTSALALFKDVVFIVDPRDRGIKDLVDYGAVPKPKEIIVPQDFTGMKAAVENFIEGSHRCLVMESMTGIGAMIDDHTLFTDYESKRKAFQNYQNGQDTSANVYLQQLSDLWLKGQEEGKLIFITAHTRVSGSSGKNVTGEDWVASALDVTPQIGRRLQALIPNIFNIGWRTGVEKVGAKQKATAIDLKLFTSFNPYFPGKNRLALPPEKQELDYPSKAVDVYKLYCELLRLCPETNRRLP